MLTEGEKRKERERKRKDIEVAARKKRKHHVKTDRDANQKEKKTDRGLDGRKKLKYPSVASLVHVAREIEASSSAQTCQSRNVQVMYREVCHYHCLPFPPLQKGIHLWERGMMEERELLGPRFHVAGPMTRWIARCHAEKET